MLTLKIEGQIPSGKNAIQLRAAKMKDGRNFIMKYPNKRFVAWRKEAVEQLTPQIPKDFKQIEEPVDVVINYYSSDKRKRDVPGMIDALWHLLEKGLEIVKDDVLLGGPGKSVFFKNHGKHPDKVGVILEIL